METSTNQTFLAWPVRLCPGVSTAIPCPFWGCGVVWNASGRGVCGVVFGALLGPEATGPFCSNAWGHLLVFLLFLLPVLPIVSPFCGVVVVWLTGLLFENYIVDASI